MVAMEDDEYEDQDDEEEEQDVKVDFIKALKEYGEKVTGLCSGDKSTLKAMKAMTKTLNNSLKSTPHMLQQQMHGFGARGGASRRTKTGMIMKPNPPAVAARVAPGSMQHLILPRI